MSTMSEDAEARVHCVPVPAEPGGNPAHSIWRIEAISRDVLERRQVPIMEADGVAVSEFQTPVQDRTTGLWVTYGYTMDAPPLE